MRKDSFSQNIALEVKQAGFIVIQGKELELKDALMKKAEKVIAKLYEKVHIEDLFNKQESKAFLSKLGKIITHPNDLGHWSDLNVKMEFINKELSTSLYSEFLQSELIIKKSMKNIFFMALFLFRDYLAPELRAKRTYAEDVSFKSILIGANIINYSKFLNSWKTPRSDLKTRELIVNLKLFLMDPNKHLSLTERLEFYKALILKVSSEQDMANSINAILNNIIFFEQEVIKSSKSHDYYLERLRNL